MVKYCSSCYMDVEVEEEVEICPECGTKLEDPFSEEESEQMLELLMNQIRA